MNEKLSLSVHDEIPTEEARVVNQGLGDFNATAAPIHEVRPLSCFARLESGALVGGAIGRTWGQCCELQQLWVDPAHRLQARPFYERLGYEARLEIRGFAPGVAKYIMVRR